MTVFSRCVCTCCAWVVVVFCGSTLWAQVPIAFPPAPPATPAAPDGRAYSVTVDVQPSTLRPGEPIRGTLTLTVKGLPKLTDMKLVVELTENAKPDVQDFGGSDLYVEDGHREKALNGVKDGTQSFDLASDFPLKMPATGENFTIKVFVRDDRPYSTHVGGALLRMADSPKRIILKSATVSPAGQRKVGDTVEFKLSYTVEGLPVPPAKAAVISQDIEFERQHFTSDKTPFWGSADGGKVLHELCDASGAKLVEATSRFTIGEATAHQVRYEVASPAFAHLTGQISIDVAPAPPPSPAILTGATLDLTDFDQRAVATLRSLDSGKSVDPKTVTKAQAQSLARWDKYTRPDGGKAQTYALNFGTAGADRANTGVYKITVGEPFADAKDWTSLVKAPLEGQMAEVLYRRVSLSDAEQYINVGVRAKIAGVIFSITQRRPNDPTKEPKAGGEYLIGRLKELIALARQNGLVGGQIKFMLVSESTSTALSDESLVLSLGEKEITRTVRIDYQGPRDVPGAQPKKLAIRLSGIYAPTVTWGIGAEKTKGDQKLTVDLAKHPFPLDLTIILPADDSPAVRDVAYQQLRQAASATPAPALDLKASLLMEYK